MLPEDRPINIYTDGSTRKNGKADGGQGAWGFIAVQNDDIVRQEAGSINNTTNQQCELMAIIKACEWAEKEYPNCPKTVYSDSAYAINCYKDKWYVKWESNGWTGSNKSPVKNQRLWKQLIPFFKNDKFFFQKVKGHSTNKYNNMIDEMVQTITLAMVR